MTNRRAISSLIILVFILIVLPLAVFLSRQRQEIRKKAAANDISISFGNASVSAGGSTIGAVNVTAGSTPVQLARATFTFDPAKVTVSNLNCGTDLSSSIGASISGGTATITCYKAGGAGVSGKTFSAATFTVQVLSGVTNGTPIPFTLTGNTILSATDGSPITGSLNIGTITVGGASVGGAPVSLFFTSSSLSPGGSTSGTVNVTASSTPVQLVRATFTFDPAKVTVSNLNCGADLSTKTADSISSGTATITCFKAGGAGVSGRTFSAATFTVQVLSSVANGTSIPFTLTSNTAVNSTAGDTITGSLTNSNITVGTTATSTATAAPSCGSQGANCCNVTGIGQGTCNSGLGCVVRPPAGSVCCPNGYYWSPTGCQLQSTPVPTPVPTTTATPAPGTPMAALLPTSSTINSGSSKMLNVRIINGNGSVYRVSFTGVNMGIPWTMCYLHPDSDDYTTSCNFSATGFAVNAGTYIVRVYPDSAISTALGDINGQSNLSTITVMAATAAPTASPGEHIASFSISPVSGNYQVNDLINTDVILDTHGRLTSGADIILSYPPELLEIQQAQDVSYGPSPLYTSNTPSRDNVNGKLISISTMSSAANTFSGKATLLSVKFKVKASGTANLRFECTSDARSDTNVWSVGQDIVNCDLVTGSMYTLSGGSVVRKAGDTNNNGCIGARDLGFVYGHYQTSSQCSPSATPSPVGPATNGDFNSDGCVDDLDLSVVSSNFSYSCNE